MKKRLFLLMLSFICTQLLVGQDFYCKMPIGVKKAKQMEGFTDDSNNSCLVRQDDGKLYFTYIENSTKETNSVVVNCPPESKLILAGVQSSADHFYFYYRNKKEKKYLLLYTIIKADIGQSYKTVIELPFVKKDKYIASYAYDKHFYIIYFNKKIDKVAVITFDEPAKARRIELEGDTKIKQLRIKALLNEGKFTNVYPNEEINLGKSASIDKIYFSSNNQLVFVSERQQTKPSISKTAIAIFDLAQGKINYNEIVFPVLLNWYNCVNSYLYKDVLFRTIITPEFLDLETYHLDSFRLIKKYHYPKPNTIDLLSEGDIYRGDNNEIYPEAEKIEKWSKVYKRLNRGYPFISVQSTVDDLFRVRIGSLKYSESGGGMMMPGAGFGGGGPTFNSFSYGKNKEVFDLTYFDAFLSTSDFSIIEGPDLVEKERKMQDFTKGLYKQNKFVENVLNLKKWIQPTIFTYPMNSATILFGYIDKKTKELNLYTF